MGRQFLADYQKPTALWKNIFTMTEMLTMKGNVPIT